MIFGAGFEDFLKKGFVERISFDARMEGPISVKGVLEPKGYLNMSFIPSHTC